MPESHDYGRRTPSRANWQQIIGRQPVIEFEQEYFNKWFTPSKSEPECYVAEASDLGLKTTLAHNLRINNWPTPSANTDFLYTGPDMNGDDIAGFNYKEKDGKRTILIIND